MPVYNTAEYLSDAVASIQHQSFADFEFIIVDDGSTDGSADVLAYHAARDARITVLRNARNAGRAAARNRALAAQPQGEFIAIMDSDDIAFPERLTRQVAFL